MKITHEMNGEQPPKIWVLYARLARALRFAWQKGQGPFRYGGE